MEASASFKYLVELVQKVNRGELSFHAEDGLIYVRTKEGAKAVLNEHLLYVRHGSDDMLPYPLNP